MLALGMGDSTSGEPVLLDTNVDQCAEKEAGREVPQQSMEAGDGMVGSKGRC